MSPDPPVLRPRSQLVVGAILGLGAALRLYSYLANPSLTVDDAMLAVNVASRSFLGLLRPLALEQTAPVGFLWALKAATVLGGVHDPVLRLVPMLAGVALPFAVWRVARELVSPDAALVAAAFAALSPILVQYSVSAKPYGVDALVTVLLVGATLDVLNAPERRERWWRLALGGVGALLCSTPSVFVLLACGVALACSPAVRGLPNPAVRLGGLALLWCGVFSGVYFAVVRPEANSPYMQAFWADKFLTPAALTDPEHTWNLLRRVPTEVFVPDRPLDWLPPATWVATLAGAWRLARIGVARLVLVVGPFAALLAASALRRYPIAPRVCVFVAPLFFLLYALAYDAAVLRWPGPWARRALAAAAGLWVATLAVLAVNTRFWGPAMRPLVAEFARRVAPGEPLYVFSGAVPWWTVYATNWRAPDTTQLGVIIRSQAVTGNGFHNAPSRRQAVGDTAGAGLALQLPDRVLVIGLSPGIQWREGVGFNKKLPDPGWGEREAARLAAVTDSTAWIAIAHDYPGVMQVLLGAMQEAGGREVFRWGARGVWLLRYRFPSRGGKAQHGLRPSSGRARRAGGSSTRRGARSPFARGCAPARPGAGNLAGSGGRSTEHRGASERLFAALPTPRLSSADR